MKYKVYQYAISSIYKYNKSFLLVTLITNLILGFQTYLVLNLNKRMMESLVSFQLTETLLLTLLLLLIELIEYSLGLFMQHYNNYHEEHFSFHNEKKFYQYISELTLVEKEQPGFLSNLQKVRHGMNRILFIFFASNRILKALTSTVLSIYLLCSHSLILGLFIFIVSLLRGLLLFKIVDPIVQNNLEHIKRVTKTEYASGILKRKEFQKELIVFKTFPYFQKLWSDMNSNLIKLTMEISKINIRPSLIGQIVATLCRGVTYIILIFLVVSKKISLGDYIALTMATTIAESNITNFMSQSRVIFENQKYIDEYYLTMLTHQRMKDKVQLFNKLDFIFENKIEINDLTMYYPNSSKPALNKINLSIKKGEKIAIVGDNAAGKSTLIKTITGLYPAPPNKVFYDGVEQGDINLYSVWDKCGVIFQDFIRYQLTLKENIVLGRENIDDLFVDELLSAFGIDLEEFSQKIETMLGDIDDNAVDLSGGQWQKVALVRLLCRPLEMIILDEPTAALDPISEMQVFKVLLELTEEKTVIIISHRIGIAREVDRIIFMKNGKILEEGNHSDLMKIKGYYYETWRAQSEWYLEENRSLQEIK